MKRLITAILCISIMLCSFACKKVENTNNETVNETEMPEVVTGTIVFRDYGAMTFELYPKKAPQSVYNFIHLAKSGFYNGIIVHRLIKDFVIQAGAYESGFVERASDNKNIYGEFSENGFDNPIKHIKGTLSWARPKAYDGASTQFFICTGDEMVKSLDGSYAAFGMITSGFDVMDAINVVETDMYDMPTSEVVIEKVTIDSDYEFPLPDYVG